MPYKKTSIVILTYNELNLTKACLESIGQYTNVPYEIIVVDNNSTDGTAAWLRQREGIRVIYNDENLGFPKGCNQGIAIAEPENDILLLNNDVIVTHNWLSNMQQALHSSSDIGACGCLSNKGACNQTYDAKYETLSEYHEFTAGFNAPNPALWERRVKLSGFCLLIKSGAVHRVGVMDEIFTPGNFEDDDYSVRLLLAGYKLLLCKDVFIHHYGSSSFKKDAGAYQKILKANQLKFTEKWGFISDYTNLGRFGITPFIKRRQNESFRVLEVGCECGTMFLDIKAAYPDAELFGIELNKVPALIASACANVITADAENFEPDYPLKSFDYIIFDEVLECVRNPWSILKKYRMFLKPDGMIIVGLHNITHHSVFSALMKGSFTYGVAGTLATDHLRFFALDNILEMLDDCGFADTFVGVKKLIRTPGEDKIVNDLVGISSAEMEEQFRIYKYIITAESKSGRK